MRRSLALGSIAVTSAVSLAFGVGSAGAAAPQPGGCPAFGAFMGAAAPWSAENQRPLGQAVRQLTPFNGALAIHKGPLCS